MAKNSSEKQKVIITKNGSYLVSGDLPLKKEISVTDDEHCPVKWQETEKYPPQENYSLCRCGQSANKPFCDGAHIKNKFDGSETATLDPHHKQAEKINGPELDLMDAQDLCSGARFCHFAKGTWNDVVNSDNAESKKNAIKSACLCPSGRLVVCNKKTGQPIEPKHERSISITEDPDAKASGPIWLKGDVELESEDGRKYETRNRVTLCRCGKSANKPFCDGSHLDAKFNDGDKSIQ